MAKKKPTRKKRYKKPSPNDGRPRIEFSQDDFHKLAKLCEIQCTLEDIADFFDVSPDTIENRVKEKYNKTFSEYFRQKSAASRVGLRTWMWQKAKQGNITMMIFLSKQKHLLKYTDRIHDDSYEKFITACNELEEKKANEDKG